MSELDLEAIKARLERLVSKPPWEVRGELATGANVFHTWKDRDYALPGCFNCGENDAVYEFEDASFIANAPTDIASLIAEVERLQAELKEQNQFDDPKVAENEAVAFISADYRDGYASALALPVNIADRIGSGEVEDARPLAVIDPESKTDSALGGRGCGLLHAVQGAFPTRPSHDLVGRQKISSA